MYTNAPRVQDVQCTQMYPRVKDGMVFRLALFPHTIIMKNIRPISHIIIIKNIRSISPYHYNKKTHLRSSFKGLKEPQ